MTTDAPTHAGSCHCGKVRFEVTATFDKAMTCNCSICRRTGMMMAFVPMGQFTLLAGEDALTDYQFNKQVIHHLFCSTCGVRAFGRGVVGGNEMAAINLRCVDGIDLDGIEIQKYDGASR